MNKPTRRVRANSEPPPDMPIQFADEDEAVQKEIDETIGLIWFLVIIVVVTVVMMAIWGRL